MTKIIHVELDPQIAKDRAEWEAGAFDREYAEAERSRQQAYQAESDPLFFTYQRSDDGATKQAWLDKVAEIKTRFPYPVKD